ncbi:SDR family oxidoreductase [Algiphilus sp. W345]|uniref:SDR family oxidoreductase n=1 Tax=Banduia mediterranea TaxID=3075609 RepID=A0ABU2WE38_9GAMM|nr:SDR family oxidoreductase [Algiphilus sp. W345]MDT0496136.1 SDR family oxidoreductase [Algiphilus sp. W345]
MITGGGSNIGRAIVLAFAREGANITIGDIDEGQANKVAELARTRGASDVQAIKADTTQIDQVDAMMEAAASRYGGIDVLVNNVGWDQLMFFTQTTPEFWDKIIRINFVSVLNCTSAALKRMIPAQKGSIVSISSDASRQGEPREAVYGGMKAAVNSLMKTVAKENGRYGVRCNCICPGVTIPETDDEVGSASMWSKPLFTPDQLEKVAAALPLKKVGRPADIANAVLFLSSSAAAGHITGQVLSVSGGYSMIG